MAAGCPSDDAADCRPREAVGAGRLALAEYERRVQCVWSAASGESLAAVTADLPAPVDEPVLPGPNSNLRKTATAALAAALLALAALVATADDPPEPEPEPVTTRVVPAEAAVFDIGRHTGTLRVVVPDGVRVDPSRIEIAATGHTSCDEACAWPTGPQLRLTEPSSATSRSHPRESATQAPTSTSSSAATPSRDRPSAAAQEQASAAPT